MYTIQCDPDLGANKVDVRNIPYTYRMCIEQLEYA